MICFLGFLSSDLLVLVPPTVDVTRLSLFFFYLQPGVSMFALSGCTFSDSEERRVALLHLIRRKASVMLPSKARFL